MNHLAELEIKSFRNVLPTKLVFRPGINVVLGRNAAGKTTLLNVLSRVLRGVYANRPEEPFDWSYVEKSELGHMRRSSRGVREDHPEGMLGLPPVVHQADEFECEFADSLPSKRLVASVRDGRVTMGGETALMQDAAPVFSLLRYLIDHAPELAPLFNVFAHSTAFRLDESLEYLSRLLTLQVTRPGDDAGLTELPRGLGKLITARFDPNLRDGLRLSADFLQRVATAMGYEKAEALLDVESKTAGSTSLNTFRNLRFAFSLGKDTIFHESLSYGEKRLLAFFAAADACPNFLIVDELVNGLHHEWIKACLEEIGPRQAFLTSQNPLMLDYLEFSSADEVARSFVLCERLRTPQGTKLSWRNPTQEEAIDFFMAYESGIQRVSDILFTKGLW